MFTAILFERHSRSALTAVIKEMQKDYTPKKGDRFNVDGLTYEIGNLSVKSSVLSFELSSKIPHDSIPADKHDEFYKKVVAAVDAQGKLYSEARKEGITKAKDAEQKRDYVKLIYNLPLEEIFDQNGITEQVLQGKLKVSDEEIAHIKGSFSKMGKIVVLFFEKAVHDLFCSEIKKLIEANKKAQ